MTRLGPSQSSLFVSNADGSSEQKLTEGYLDYNPAWSPDGQWIVFTSERNGSADLYRMRPDGSGLERLADDPAYEDQAAFSPDGNQVAFAAYEGQPGAGIYLALVGGEKSLRLTSNPADCCPTWSPDGRQIAFVRRSESATDMGFYLSLIHI